MEKDIPLVEIQNGYLIRNYDSDNTFKNYIPHGSCYIPYGDGNLLISFHGTPYPFNQGDDCPHIDRAYVQNIFGKDILPSSLKKECLTLLEKMTLSFPSNKSLSKINFNIIEKSDSDIFTFLKEMNVFFGALGSPVLNHPFPFKNH